MLLQQQVGPEGPLGPLRMRLFYMAPFVYSCLFQWALEDLQACFFFPHMFLLGSCLFIDGQPMLASCMLVAKLD